MKTFTELPAEKLVPAGPITARFLALGVPDFREAARYLLSLPYGRTSDRADVTLVLNEGRGTCSSKHALLAQLAAEQRVPVTLTLGIYEMTEANTPGAGRILASHGLSSLPEAHCYVVHSGRRVDITRSGKEPAEPITRFLHEEIIRPEQVGKYKEAVHRRFLTQWLTSMPGGRTPEEVWRIREECIAALGQ